MREEHARPLPAPPPRRRSRSGAVRRRRPGEAHRGRARPLPQADSGRLPGPLRVAGSPAAGGSDAPGGARRSRHRHPVDAATARGRAARPGRPQPGRRPEVPGRVLRRAAPACRHRPGAGRGARAADRRRTPVGPGRLDPGPDPAASPRSAGVARPDDDLHLARPSRRPVPERPGRGDVPGHHRGARAHRRALRAAAASLHDGAPLGGARGGRRPARARSDRGRASERRADPAGMSVPPAVPFQGGAVFPRVAARSTSSCPATWSRATSWRIAWRPARLRGATRR